MPQPLFPITPFSPFQDESGNFRRPDTAGTAGTTDHADATNMFGDKHDLPRLRSALASRHPHLACHFHSSGLFRPADGEYADTRTTNTLLRAHRQMVRLRAMDAVLQAA